MPPPMPDCVDDHSYIIGLNNEKSDFSYFFFFFQNCFSYFRAFPLHYKF